jgi:hypothetical protein
MLTDPKGPDKVTRGWGKWEPIKIARENLAYVLNQTKRASLLTQSKSHSMDSY